MNLTKSRKNLYTDKYKIFMKETEEDNKWKDILYSQIVRIHTSKLSKCPYAMSNCKMSNAI